MNLRKWSVLAGIALLIGAVLISWYLSSSATDSKSQSQSTAYASVPVQVAEPKSITSEIPFTGRVVADEQITLQSEVVGRLLPGNPKFKTGNRFFKGDTILSVYDEEARQQLQAGKFRFAALISRLLPDMSVDYPEAYKDWSKYLDHFEASKPLPPLPEATRRQVRLFLNSRDVYSQYHSLKQQEARLAKFTIEAPFTGILTESTIDAGALVQPNQRLGEFTKLNPLEIETSIPASLTDQFETGDRVRLHLDQTEKEVTKGEIIRMNAKIDRATQSVKIFIELTDTTLKPGAYVEGTIRGKTYRNVTKIPNDALVRDRQIFVLEDSTAVMRTIDLVATDADSVIIRGFTPGDRIVTEFHNAAFAGTPAVPIQSR